MINKGIDMTNLEDKLLYRLVKVIYIIVFLLSGLIAIFIGWESRPQPEVDDEKSRIACDNGKNYKLSANRIYVYSVDTTSLSNYQDEEARKLCQYGVLNDYSTSYRNLATPTHQNYQLKIVEGTRGSWTNAILWWVLGIAGSYVALNLIRETINYILFGKPFDWMWLIVPIALIASSNNEQS